MKMLTAAFQLCTLIVFLCPGLAKSKQSDEVLSVPRKVFEDAKKRGLNPVENFYSFPGVNAPPYVFGYCDSDLMFELDSFVYWAEKPGASANKKYVLVIKMSKKDRCITCPDIINWEPEELGGLKLTTEKSKDLSSYRSLEKPRLAGPKIGEKGLRVIVVDYEEESHQLVCFQGKWWVKYFH